jgi:hypothetical protein
MAEDRQRANDLRILDPGRTIDKWVMKLGMGKTANQADQMKIQTVFP